MYRTILLPIDLGEEASWAKALPTAVASAKAYGAELWIMTVVPDFGMSIVAQQFPSDFEEKALQDAQESLTQFVDQNVPDDTSAHRLVGHGSIYGEILAAADRIKADLIIMGSHRPALQDYLLGPNAARVVRHAKQSVMVVRD